MILLEKSTEKDLIAVDVLMWLTRALYMILLFFERIVEDHKAGKATEDLVAFLKEAYYKETLEPYHAPITYIMMIPTRSQLLLPLAVEEPDNYKETLEPYHGCMAQQLFNLITYVTYDTYLFATLTIISR
ncbi:unnamed protein product [Lasius platythorax]|uniref:Glycolipid transfer protein domain-containing protein n=1 Tax=Lasius platythorax TaxID=488582 RepID=A0AAV2N4T9_9HYME